MLQRYDERARNHIDIVRMTSLEKTIPYELAAKTFNENRVTRRLPLGHFPEQIEYPLPKQIKTVP